MAVGRCAAATGGRSGGAVQLQVGGETWGGRFCFDLGKTCVVLLLLLLLLREPRMLTQAHPQVGSVGEVKIHVEGVGSPAVVVGEEAIHNRRAVSLRLLLAICRMWKVKRLRGEIPVHLALCLCGGGEKRKHTENKV